MTIRRMLAIAGLAALLVAGLPAGAIAAKHSADNEVVKGQGGVDIAITVFKPATASSSNRVPVVLQSHGWGGSRETEIGGDVEKFLDAGMGIVSIDQRGHGESGGQANVQDPELETEDIQNVIDYIATLDWVELDRPGDPVLGAIGVSYGGGYQTMTALDEIAETGSTRFNALAPQITWYDLPQSLAPNKVVRTAWNVLLYGAGSSMVPDYIHEAFAWGSATGQWPDGTLYGQKVPGAPNLDKVFHAHSPIGFVEKGIHIDVPVLIRQGTSDNLFPLNEGLNNFNKTLTHKARSQSYFVAYNGGHAFPNALPAGEPVAVELGTGADACTDFTKVTIEFYKRVFAGRSTAGVLPSQYNLTTLDGKCFRTDSLESKSSKFDPLGVGSIVTTAGAGAPIQLDAAQGPLTLAGIPNLKGTVASTALDGRAFIGLSVGSTPADAKVIQNNLMPLRQILPTAGDKFNIDLAGVVAEIPKGENVYLTITPISDMFFGHASRTPAALVLSDLKLSLPKAK